MAWTVAAIWLAVNGIVALAGWRWHQTRHRQN